MEDIFAFISFFFGASWNFFARVKVPGFNFSIGDFLICIFLMHFSFRILGGMLRMSFSANTIGTGISGLRDRFRGDSK